MPLDSQIPLSAAQPQSYAKAAGQVYELADQVNRQREAQQQQKDQQYIQQALKEGANFETPEGIADFAKKAKGTIGPKTYMTLTQAAQEAKLKQNQIMEHFAKAGSDVIKAEQEKIDFMKENVEAPITAYKEAKAAGKTEEEAMLAFENGKTQKRQQMESMQVGGKPVFEKQELDQFTAGTPAIFNAQFETLESRRKTLMDAEKLAGETQKIKTDKALESERLARAKALKEGEGGGTLGTNELQSAGAQIARGMPLTQVIPGMSKTVQAKREKAREEAIRQIMEEQPGMTYTEAGIELADRNIDYAATRAGRTQTARTVGATEANIVMASSEAKKMIAIVRDVETKMNLTEYPSINAIENAVSKGTGGTQVVKLNNALMALINTYARAINPKGVPTVEDKKTARDALNTALSKGQMEAGLSVMEQEMDASLASPAAARKVLDRVKSLGGKKEENTGKSTVVPHETLPKGMPEGSKQAGHTPDGKPVWKAPNGKMYVEE